MPSSKWNKIKKGQTDEEAAFAVASELTKPLPPAEKTSLSRAGGKRKEYGRSNRPPLPGCSKEDSDIMRHIVGLKYAGYTQNEAFDKVGINRGSGGGWIARRQEAYDAADHELMELALRGYQSNLWIMRTALSELGPRAVRTLGDIMDNKKETGKTRLTAATTILKLVDVDHSATGGAAEGLAKELADALRSATSDINSGKIVDAEDVEVIQDGDDGSSVAVQSN